MLKLLLLLSCLPSFVQIQAQDSEDHDHSDSDDRHGNSYSGLAAGRLAHTRVALVQEITNFEEEPVSELALSPGISPDEVEAGGKLGVPVVFGASTPSVDVAERGAPVSEYWPSVRLIVVVCVSEAVSVVTVVEVV